MTEKFVLITGSAGGIGRALVTKFIAEGYSVIGLDLNTQPKVEGLFPLQIDIRRLVKEADYLATLEESVKELTSGKGISVLINNAAVQLLDTAQDFPLDDWMRTFDINLHAPFILSKTFYKALSDNNGSVINVSSIHARLTKKTFSAYATSKAALSSLTRNLALDFQGKVRINAIEPAAIATDMLREGFIGKENEYGKLESYHPQGRIGTPEEVANLAYYLCSDASGFLHGSCIALDGGISGCLKDPS
ncbi:SDR family NAD(P)-dependent oxidoreductase [Pseudoalteromonas sp. SS15]|uniref:SDR family NAD(P)-dependent oxidoreductase n=1 Tax=Pseudoalteromonas sp. SS15 TaxID=3139393 RepID=UPI003BA97642